MTRWTKRTVGIVAAIIVVQVITIGGVVALGVVAHQQSERAVQAENAAAAEEEQRDAEAAERAEAIEALREQVLQLGEEPVVETDPDASSSTVIKGQDGKDAPPPTPEQMLAAVQQCFALGLCTAPKGETGDEGDKGDPGNDSTTPGPTGVGIATIECLDDGTWRFTMTDTTTRDIPGPCRIVPTPDPPEGEPTP